MSSPTAMPMRHVEHCMGTVFSFDVRSPGIDRATLDSALAWLHHVDATFSTYRPDSVISKLATGSIRQGQLSEQVRTVLDQCAELTTLTDGYFSAHANGDLDPSGYVKGWAIEIASDILESAGSRNHCINGGGDVQCVGRPEPGQPWRVGVSDPLHAGRLVQTIQGYGRLAVATSGTAERGTHITDPHTRRPPTGLASVTVVGANLTLVDAYATAAFAMGSAAQNWLAGIATITSVVVLDDGTVIVDPAPAVAETGHSRLVRASRSASAAGSAGPRSSR